MNNTNTPHLHFYVNFDDVDRRIKRAIEDLPQTVSSTCLAPYPSCDLSELTEQLRNSECNLGQICVPWCLSERYNHYLYHKDGGGIYLVSVSSLLSSNNVFATLI